MKQNIAVLQNEKEKKKEKKKKESKEAQNIKFLS